jgi:hypothetical protein
MRGCSLGELAVIAGVVGLLYLQAKVGERLGARTGNARAGFWLGWFGSWMGWIATMFLPDHRRR